MALESNIVHVGQLSYWASLSGVCVGHECAFDLRVTLSVCCARSGVRLSVQFDRWVRDLRATYVDEVAQAQQPAHNVFIWGLVSVLPVYLACSSMPLFLTVNVKAGVADAECMSNQYGC
jgi:hypothetical protein